MLNCSFIGFMKTKESRLHSSLNVKNEDPFVFPFMDLADGGSDLSMEILINRLHG